MKIANFTFKESDLISFRSFTKDITPNRDWNKIYESGLVIKTLHEENKIVYSTRGGERRGMQWGRGNVEDKDFFSSYREDVDILTKTISKGSD